jgi:hypothetical protein
MIDAFNITFKQHYITHTLYVTKGKYSGKDKKDGQPGIGLARLALKKEEKITKPPTTHSLTSNFAHQPLG